MCSPRLRRLLDIWFRAVGFSSVWCATYLAVSQPLNLEDLPKLTPGQTKAENALWIENALSTRFNTSKRVAVADLKGPAVITMIHFAMPQTLKLNRDVLLRMYWDGEASPSVDCPLVDFFCDPAGLRDQVNAALVNKRRGFHAYFAMPFRRSAIIELVYDGPVAPGDELWKIMPCYSYVMYRSSKKISSDTGYFHASWRQEALLLGKRDYVALEASGKGKFIGWNVTGRSPGHDGYHGAWLLGRMEATLLRRQWTNSFYSIKTRRPVRASHAARGERTIWRDLTQTAIEPKGRVQTKRLLN